MSVRVCTCVCMCTCVAAKPAEAHAGRQEALSENTHQVSRGEAHTNGGQVLVLC